MSDPRSEHPGPGTALITGATAGIGLEFAQQLAARGFDLVLAARDQARLDATAAALSKRHGVTIETLSSDLTARAGMALVEARLNDPDQPIELLVNNAGFGLKGRFLDNSVDAETEMLDVLVTAVLRLSHAHLAAIVPRGHGGLINVSSVAAFLPRGSYSAAKAWVNSFGEWAHQEYATDQLRVLTLCPGFTKTEFHERMGVSRDSAPDFLWLDADFLVRTALADYDSGRMMSIPGAQYRLVAGATRLIPKRILQGFQALGRR